MHGGKCKRHRPLNTPIKKNLKKKKKRKKKKKLGLTEKDKYHMISSTYRILKRYK